MDKNNITQAIAAAAQRKAELKALGTRNLTISEIQELPRFFDWVECEVYGRRFVMYCAGGDDGVAMKCYWNGSYESNTLRIWSILARQSPSKIIIDVGAHTGIYSLSAISQGAKHILSIEPHFANFSRLNINLRANSYPTTNTRMLAAGDSKGWATFVLPTNIDYLSTGGKISDNAVGLKFPVMTMPLDGLVDLTKHGEVSMLKIDVEGLEHTVLTGAREIIAKSKPYIFIECVDKEASSRAEDILNSYGYEYYLIEDDRATIRRVEKLAPEYQEYDKINMFRLNRIAVPKGIGLAPLLVD